MIMYHQSTKAILLLSLWQWSTQAFITMPSRRSTSATTRLYYKDEKTVVANPVEEKVSKEPSAPLTDAEKAKKTMKELTKTRPYPIFVAEKVAGTLEHTAKGLGKMFKGGNQDEPTSIPRKKREKIVVLGVGWGSAALLADIDTDVYDVTVISPRNHFVFTPMLAGSAVGTVEARSISQPIREINRNVKYIEAKATSIDPSTRTISCESIICADDQPNDCLLPDEFTVDYDRLVVSVGAQTNTFGIPGVYEHCEFIKETSDALRIRKKIVNCFERAKVPGLSDEEKRRRLSFVVIGAGPAGLEFTAELRDFIEQDGPKYYCDLIPYVSIKLVEATGTVLAPFEKPLQDEAAARITRPAKIYCPKTREKVSVDFTLTELMLNSPVTKIDVDTLTLKDGRVLDHSLAVWAGGIKPLPLTSDLITSLGSAQEAIKDQARGRIGVDPWLRAYGGHGRILALGDCAVNPDGPLPPTGQVAAQQGEFLAHLLNQKFDLSPPSCSTDGQVANKDDTSLLTPPVRIPNETLESLEDKIAAIATHHPEYAKPFQYLNLGILAYTGDCTAVGQISTSPQTPAVLASSHAGNFLWRSIYLAKQVSLRNRVLVMNDWVKRVWFGRDISRL